MRGLGYGLDEVMKRKFDKDAKRLKRVVEGKESAIDFMVDLLKPDAQQHQVTTDDWNELDNIVAKAPGYGLHMPSTPKQQHQGAQLVSADEDGLHIDTGIVGPATINPYIDQYWSPETIETKAFARRVKLAARHGVKLVKDAYGDIWALRVGCPSVRVG